MAATVVLGLIISVEPEVAAAVVLLGLTMLQALQVAVMVAAATVVQLILPKLAQGQRTLVAAAVRLGQLAALKMAVLVLLLFSIGFSKWLTLQN
jgi:hypothetical protein